MGIIKRYQNESMLDSLILLMKWIVEHPVSEELYIKTFDISQLEKINKAIEWSIKNEAFELIFKICTRF